MSKLAALFGIPTTILGGAATLEYVSGPVAGVMMLSLGAVQFAVWAVFSPSVPWLGEKPPAGPKFPPGA